MIVVTNRIPVATGHEIDFEDRFRRRVHLVDRHPGFIRNEVHRPKPMKLDHEKGTWAEDPTAQGYYEFIVQAGDRLTALHISDNDRSGRVHLLPFEGGTVDWPAVMRGLRDVQYDALFNFEIPGETQCPLPERLEKLDWASEIADRLMSMEV